MSKKKVVQFVIRMALSALMLYQVYQETGPWTVTTLAMVLIALELSAWLTGRLAKRL